MNSKQRLVIVPQEEIGTINPNLHGHFSEHIGECIYPGISVPVNGSIPNTNGLRHDVIEALKPLEIPILRWPGGCFADDYHWRDGIGPADKRPTRLNRHWGLTEEDSQFGTHEFMEFCRLLGAQPYFAANLGSGTPSEMSDWIEYCNYAGNSSLATERRVNGAQEPFGVRYWGIGNETWGCGGNMSPEQYAGEFFRYRTFAGDYSGTKVEAIACGQDNNDWQWARRFFEFARGNYRNQLNAAGGFGGHHGIGAFAAHYYCGTSGTATRYDDRQWLELLAKAYAIEGIVTGTRGIMDEYDPKRKIPFFLDEWGAWHPVEEGKTEHGLYQQNTVRDACVTALSLDVFHNHADKVQMANIAQLINVLQSVLLIEEDKCIKTPTYHVFDLYKPHKGATAVRVESLSEIITDGGAAAHWCRTRYLDGRRFGLRAVHGSASVKEGKLCVTAVNTHPTETIELEVEIYGSRWAAEVEVTLLDAGDIRAYNTFSAPENVKLSAPVTLREQKSIATIQLSPGAVARLRGPIA